MSTLALPTGRLYPTLIEYFHNKLGVDLPKLEERKYFYNNFIKDSDVNLFLAKPKSIANLVGCGYADIGVCGEDIILNSQYKNELEVISVLGDFKVRISLCSRKTKEDFTTDKTEHDRLNNERVIELIKKIPFEKRNAYFEVCFTVMKNGVELFKVTKQSHGFVIDELKGKNGFGYDPIFVGNDTFGKTYAELDSTRKNLRSHRKAALNEVGRFFAEYMKK